MSRTIKELYKDYTYETRYEIISRFIRMALPFLNNLFLYLCLFVLPIRSRFLWSALGASLFNAFMITAGVFLVYLI